MGKLKSALLGGAILAACVTSASAFPGIGNDTLGPQLIITLNSNGTASVGPGPGSAAGSLSMEVTTPISVSSITPVRP